MNTRVGMIMVARAVSMIRAANSSEDAVQSAFAILDSVAQPNTRWSIVYDPAAGTVHYRTDQNREPRWVAFSSFEPGYASPVNRTRPKRVASAGRRIRRRKSAFR